MKQIEYNGLQMHICSATEWETRKRNGTLLHAMIEWPNGIVWVTAWPTRTDDIHTLAGMKGKTYDTDLPKAWTDEQRRLNKDFQYWHYVWYYPERSLFGMPVNVWLAAHSQQTAQAILDLALKAPELEEDLE